MEVSIKESFQYIKQDENWIKKLALYAGFVLFFQGNKSKLLRVAVLAASVFVVYLILLTGSRKAIILLILPFIIQPLLNKRIGRKIMWIPIAAVVVVAGVYLIMNIPILYEAIGVRIEEAINIVNGSIPEAYIGTYR